MMTKNEELKVLEKIEKLIASTGEDSYISIAFDGCVADAKDNIEYDASFSMRNRFRSAMDKVIAAENKAVDTKELLDEANAKISYLETLLADAEKRCIDIDTYKRVWLALEHNESEAQEKMYKLANLLADMATQNPTIDAVHSVMMSMAAAKKELEDASSLLKAFEAYEI